jgi:hypothetical protein
VKTGEIETGTRELAEAVAWFESSRLVYTAAQFGLWLADAWLRQDQPELARAQAQRLLELTRERGYRLMEATAARLLGESLAATDPVAALAELEAAAALCEPLGARNELARTWAAQGRLRASAGDASGARVHLERAVKTFETLGTIDEIDRTQAALDALG